MKKFTAYIAAAILGIASCSNGLDLPQGVSFVSSGPVCTGDETAVFSIVTQGFDSDTEVIIPVTFGGTAVKGTDYTVSAEAFVCGGNAPVDSIVVTTLALGCGRTVTMSLDLPDGITAGANTTSGFTLHDKFGYLCFASSDSFLTDTLTFNVAILNSDSTLKTASRDVRIGIEVDKDLSTAIEGTHFTFPDSSHVTIKAGEKAASLRIASTGEAVAGHDRIVLNLSYEDTYGEGFIPDTRISVLGQEWASLNGEWHIGTLVTDSSYMQDFWQEGCTLYDGLPQFNDSDAMAFDLSICQFIPSFKSSLKDYFIGESYMAKGEELTIDLKDGQQADVQTFLFSNTNRFFSSQEQSEDPVSIVGMRIIKDAETSEDLLDLYILDHESKAFMPELQYGSEKPTAAEYGKFLNAVFRK